MESPAVLKGREIRNILVLRLRAFGDTLLTTPTLRGLKKAFPQARLSILLEPAMAQVVRGLPYVDEVVPFDRQALKKQGKIREALATLGFYRWLRRQHYDLVVDVLGTPRTAMMALATGAPVRAGFAFRVRRWAYNVVYQPSDQRKYIADYTADALRALGFQPDSLDLDFFVSKPALEYAGRFFESAGLGPREKVFMVSAAGGWSLKRYPPDLLRRAVERIQKESGLRAVMLWGPGEEETAREVMQGLTPAPLLAPPTNFDQLGALLARASLLVTNDGATKHLAVAVGTPTLTLFGPTSDVAWHPPADPRHRSVRLDLPCMPCEALTCRLGTEACMKELPPDKVAAAALEMLK